MQAQLKRAGTFRAVFEAKRETGTAGVIALDDMKFIVGSCLPTTHCDFEGGQCGFENDPFREFGWTRYKGPTPSKNTGTVLTVTSGW